jgi:hypothetical protein
LMTGGEFPNHAGYSRELIFSTDPRLARVISYSLVFNYKLVYIVYNKPSCKEPFRLISYARKNSKRLLCGFFLAKSKPIWRLVWSIQGRNDRRKGKNIQEKENDDEYLCRELIQRCNRCND